jgi:hypothetical protein
MVRARKKATTEGKRATGGESGEAPTSLKELAEKGFEDESAKAAARVAELALVGECRSLQKMMDPPNKSPQGEQSETNRNGFSQALAWTAEPEWQGELSGMDSEAAAGSREPEVLFD